MATIGGKKIATTGSEHAARASTSATSRVPPAADPPPAPFAYVAFSASASEASEKLVVAGAPALTEGSAMTLAGPGNTAAGATRGDLVTGAVNGPCVVITGSPKLLAGGKRVARTGDHVRLNLASARGAFAQSTGDLVAADSPAPPVFDVAAPDVTVLHGVSVASGAVVDDCTEIAIDGLIPLRVARLYSTARVAERTPLGHGGWTHSFHQWIARFGADLYLREADGKTLLLQGARPDQPIFHRGRRLVVTPDAAGGATIYSLDTRLYRLFQPTTQSGGAVEAGAVARLREITSLTGQRIQLAYDADRLVRIVDSAARVVELTNDASGRVVAISVLSRDADDDGPRAIATTRYEYGDDGELLRAVDLAGDATAYAYDERLRLVKKTLPSGLAVHYRYDFETGRCARAWADGGVLACDLEHDPARGITRVTGNPEPRVYTYRPRDGAVERVASSDGRIAIDRRFDDDLLVVEETVDGETFAYERDAHGNVTKIRDGLGRTTEITYTGGFPTRRRRGDRVTEYENDRNGLLARVLFPSGVELRLKRDERGRLTAAEGPNGAITTLVHDDRNNVVEEHGARGSVKRWTFDELGRAITFTDADGRATSRQLDPLGRTTALRLPDGTRLAVEYDALGRPVRRTDLRGGEWKARYAGISALLRLDGPAGSSWDLSHDALERPQTITIRSADELSTLDARYDRGGRVREVRHADGRITRVRRDRSGRARRVELGDGSWLERRLDAAGRLGAEDSPHGSITIDRGEDDRVVTHVLQDPTGDISVRIEKDERGRVVREVQGDRAVEITYEPDGRSISRRLPTGQVTRFLLDEGRRAIAVEHGGERTEIERDRSGSIVAVAFRGKKLDPRANPDDGAPIVETRWKRTPSGLLHRTEFAEYRYDARSRRVLAMLFTDEEDETVEYHWDCRSRLREVVLADRTRILSFYDALGRRVKKIVASPVRQTSPSELPPAPATRVVEYVYSGEELVAEIDSARGVRTFVALPDAMSPLLSTNAAGEVALEPRADRDYADEETGLRLAGGRWRDPRTACFLAPEEPFEPPSLLESLPREWRSDPEIDARFTIARRVARIEQRLRDADDDPGEL